MERVVNWLIILGFGLAGLAIAALIGTGRLPTLENTALSVAGFVLGSAAARAVHRRRIRRRQP